jgi:hypothetical protein
MKQTAVGMFSLLLLAGCSREQPKTYEVPKEQSAIPEQPGVADEANASVIAAHTAMNAQTSGTEFTAELPEGWTEQTGSGMRMVSYSIEGTSIDFYLISLTMGDIPSNVNRWRGQVDLPAATPDEISQDLQTFEVDGHAVSYIEIYNEEGGKGIIAAIIDLTPKYWYFTAKGSVEELKANAEDIVTFLKSLQIN